MDDVFFKELRLNETDIEGAINRLAGDEKTYKMVLSVFPQDQTMSQLEAALQCKNWDDAFTAAHALKGLAGNLGFTPLFHTLGELVIVIRAGRLDEIDSAFNNVKRDYNDIISIIQNYYKLVGG